MSFRNLFIALIVAAAVVPLAASEWTQPLPLNSYANIDPEISDSRVDVATDNENTALSLWFQNASNDGDYSKVYLSRSSDSGQTWATPKLMFQQTSSDHVLVTASAIHLGGESWMAAWVVDSPWINETILMVSHSADNGETWSTPVSKLVLEVIPNRPANTRLSMATDTTGTVVASFLSQIFRSADNGQSWIHIQTPATSTTPSIYYDPMVEQDVTSMVAYFGNERWVNIFLRKGFAGLDYNWQIFYQSASSDNGLTWTEPVRMELPRNTPQQYRRTVTADLAVDGQNALLVYNDWYDLIFASSANAGTSWTITASIPVEANYQAQNDNFPELSLAMKDQKAVVAIDRPVAANGTDMSVSYSSNGGGTWSAMAPLPGGPGLLAPSVAPMGSNTFLLNYEKMTRPVGYHVLRQISQARSTDGGITWNAGQQLNPGAPGELDLHLDTNAQIGAGNNGMMVAIWHTLSQYGDGEVGHVAYARSHDYGNSWEMARPLHATNGSADVTPVIVYCGINRWLAHWEQDGQTLASVSTDNANTWSAPTAVAAGPNLRVLDSNEQGTLLALSTTGYWRSDDYGQTWVSAGVVRYGLAAHHITGNRWIAFEDKKVSVSEDNGFVWTQISTLEGMHPEGRISVDHSADGTLIAAINYASACSYQCAGPLTIARSTDGGNSWDYYPVVTGTYSFDGLPNNVYSGTAWLGGNKWITVWGSDPSSRRATYVVSEDNGINWSEPSAPGDITLWNVVGMAVADGHATVISGALGLQPSQFFRGSFGTGVSLDDVHYSNLIVAGPAAAADWALFE